MAWSVTGNIKGPVGATGATGAAASVSVGTVTTGGAGSSASVTNSGSSSAAVFDFTIPRGDTGAQGPTGAAGSQGQPGVSVDIQGFVATYADLPSNAVAGDAYVVTADGKLYFRDATGFPADGSGVPFVGPQGPTGAAGSAGAAGSSATITVGTTTTGGAGSNASVTNSGTSSAAVFDFTVPVGATGATGQRGSQWFTGAGAPSGISGALAGDLYLDTQTGDVYSFS